MATLQATLRTQINQRVPISADGCDSNAKLNVARIVTQLNEQLYANTAPEKYATFFFALFDGSNRTLTYTNAGHLSPLLFRDGHVTRLDSNGTIVGAFPHASYDESCITLEPDDLLVCYTDGVTEPESSSGEPFGEERLIEVVQQNAARRDEDILESVFRSVRDWSPGSELSDDITLLFAREAQRS
jgi:sigma-B regulation protein RsbU (phosphoserine phosphatase)